MAKVITYRDEKEISAFVPRYSLDKIERIDYPHIISGDTVFTNRFSFSYASDNKLQSIHFTESEGGETFWELADYSGENFTSLKQYNKNGNVFFAQQLALDNHETPFKELNNDLKYIYSPTDSNLDYYFKRT